MPEEKKEEYTIEDKLGKALINQYIVGAKLRNNLKELRPTYLAFERLAK